MPSRCLQPRRTGPDRTAPEGAGTATARAGRLLAMAARRRRTRARGGSALL